MSTSGLYGNAVAPGSKLSVTTFCSDDRRNSERDETRSDFPEPAIPMTNMTYISYSRYTAVVTLEADTLSLESLEL